MYAIQAGTCAKLARMHGLPSRGGGTANDAKSVSVQSGYESMLSMLTSFQNGLYLIIHSAGILDSFAVMSYEQFVVDLEIISMVKFYHTDVDIDGDALSFEVIKEVGPGGQFLDTDDTFEKFRTHSWSPEVGLSGTLTGKTPDEKLRENIDKKLGEMLDNYEQPGLDDAVQKELERYLVDAGVDRVVIERAAAA